MDEIKDIVQRVVGDIALTKQKEQENIHNQWNRILSEKEKKHAKISGLKNGTLMIHVDSSAWLYQFNLKKNKILKSLQGAGNEISRVYFKIGKTQ